MKTRHIPMVLFAVLYLLLVTHLLKASARLPDPVATHFNGRGQANGWMSRAWFFWGSLGFGFVFPLFVVAIGWLVRLMPDYINIPHREYWLAPERRAATLFYFYRHSWWFACLAVAFILGLDLALVQANTVTPPHLSTTAVLGLGGGFLIGVGFWIISLFRHFSRPALGDG